MIPPKLHKKSEGVVRLDREDRRNRRRITSRLDKFLARRGGTLKELLQLSEHLYY